MMSAPNYGRTRFSCFFAYLAMSSVFVLPPMLFTTFREMYGISYTLLGTLIVVNFCTQMTVDTIFAFFNRYFNIRLTIRLMPLLTSLGLLIYAAVPAFWPEYAYAGLVTGTVIFSVSAGLAEVLLSPLVVAIPSKNPQKDMSLLHSLYGWGVVSVVLISSLYFYIFGTKSWGWLTLFWAVLPIAASVLFFISPIPSLELESAEKRTEKQGRTKGLLLCMLCIFLGSSAENVMTNWISGYMEIGLQIPKETGDILGLAVFALLLALTRVAYAKYTPNIMNTLLVGMIGAAVCYLIAGFSGSVLLAFAACILTGVFTAMLWPGTLIMMEEKIPVPGVAAYALMAMAGDFGASVAPQLLGVVVDKVSVSGFAAQWGETLSMAAEEIGLKTGMVVTSIFPILGIILLLYIKKTFKSK